MEVEKLFHGIGIIIDDEINDAGSTIKRIKDLLLACDIPILTFDQLPSNSMIASFSAASFIILDWDYFHENIDRIDPSEEESVILKPDTLASTEEQRLISFIKELLKSTFIPVFLFTSKKLDVIQEKLSKEKLWFTDKPNRLFIKSKNDISSKETLFGTIETWLKETPSAYVFKEWEKTITNEKNKMFVDMYDLSPNWVNIIWGMIKKDTQENMEEFGNFITRQLVNRIQEYTFDENIIQERNDIPIEELMNVVQGERYISYNAVPSEAHTGDLFIDGEQYFLNIRAQCDLSRRKNPKLYLLSGNVLSDEDILLENIRLTNDKVLHLSSNEVYSLDKLCEICQDDKELIELNKTFDNYRNIAFFYSGNIIGKRCDTIIMCVDGKKAIKFKLDICIKEYNEIKDKIKGRILPPYITSIQQSCAAYIVREGTLPTPKEIFKQ